ncbi:MAG: hypothetical protein HC890_05310 [Chloroflexaceae bacterium]|nr:hypothetical protein [Chloroflexaceae bacterium]
MDNPVVYSFFFGRALAETLLERTEEAIAETLSELGKFDAEQRERLREFTEEVVAKADRQARQSHYETVTTDGNTGESAVDLQALIDELRAEIARLRAELAYHRRPSL